MKTALVVLYNHHFEKNIDVIKKIYGDRFTELIQLMPYYYGNDESVVSVYGNSFQFYDYLIQAKERIAQLEADNILIIGDDLLLNPSFNEDSAAKTLNINNKDSFYLDGFVDVSAGTCYRGLTEAHNFSTWPAGLDGYSANRAIPSFEKAREILKKRGLMQSDKLNNYAPYYPKFHQGAKLKVNWKIFKARAYHFLKKCKYKFSPQLYSYPVVFGYSDIISIPKTQYANLCKYLEVFSAWRMFVELAIPTALLLMDDIEISTADDIQLKTGNVWYPQDPSHFEKVDKVIKTLFDKVQDDSSLLSTHFPEEYLYLHPVKLSRFAQNK